MRSLLFLAFLLIGTLFVPQAIANCYIIQNNASATQIIRFQYSKPLPGAIPVVHLNGHARFPANRQWCWNTPPEYTATASIEGKSSVPSWQGPLIIGNGGAASPSGTYFLQPLKASAVIPALPLAAEVLPVSSPPNAQPARPSLSVHSRRAGDAGTWMAAILLLAVHWTA